MDGLKLNAEVEISSILILLCNKCRNPILICKRCSYSFNRFTKLSCDEGVHRCVNCIENTQTKMKR